MIDVHSLGRRTASLGLRAGFSEVESASKRAEIKTSRKILGANAGTYDSSHIEKKKGEVYQKGKRLGDAKDEDHKGKPGTTGP